MYIVNNVDCYTWEQRKLGEISDVVGGGTPSTIKNEYWNGNIDWYSPAEIGGKIYVSGSQKRITELGLQKSSAKVLPIGTVLFTSRAGIGKTAILAKEGATNQGFQSIIPKKEILDSYFIFSKSNELKRYGEVTGAGSTFVEVSGKQMAKMPIFLPSIEEQVKISSLFKKLDYTIALHQEELNQLKLSKKGFLQKMFPKKEESVPEIRFPGFSLNWEQKELGDVSPLRGGFAFKSSNFRDSGVPIIRISNILANGSIGGEFAYYDIQEVEEKYILKNGDVLLAMSGATTGKVSRLKTLNSNKFYQNQRVGYFVNTGRADYNFISTLVISQRFLNQLKAVLVAGAQPNISSKEIDSFKFYFPKSIEEQEILGNFFKRLDDKIELHEEKLNTFKQIKKSFLQKMFI